LVDAQNQGGGGFPGLDFKIGSYNLVIWASKPSSLRFIGCITKPTGGYDSVGHTSRSSGLLHMEASPDRVSQSAPKTDGDVTAEGARVTITEVASESS
jgi:hypothetical protein